MNKWPAMTKGEFKARWESSDNGGGITYSDIADCYVAWGLGSKPRMMSLDGARYAVLNAAGTNDADEFRPASQ